VKTKLEGGEQMKALNRSCIVIFLLLTLFILACGGKTGPMGPPGEAGEPGAGTRIVYQSVAPISSEFYTVRISEIDLRDMPSISVYVALAGTDLWYELPAYFENMPDFGQICFFTQGAVTFVLCQAWFYKIVIVI